MEKPSTTPIVIGTGFGAGFWPWGPGTAGAVLATLIWGTMTIWLSPIALIIVTLGLIIVGTIAGTWATKKLQPYWGDDPSRVVIDEMVGVWVPLLAATNAWQALTALILFRFFDIVKPLGIRTLDRKKGPFWVMADDLLAGIYSLVVLHLIIYIWES